MLEDAILALPEAVALFDADGRFVLWNDKFLEFYEAPVPLERGMRFEDHVRACVKNGLVPAARGREEEWIAERLARFARAEGVHEHRLADGRCVRVQDRRLPGGGRIGIRSDMTDVADRERNALALLEANPAPVIVSDIQRQVVLWVNEAAVRFYGHDRRTFVGLHVRDYRVEASPGEIEASIPHAGTPEFDARPRVHRTASGEHRVVKITSSRSVFDGRPVMVVAVTDVTELHRAQAELRSARNFLRKIVDQVPTAVFAKDMADDGRFVVYNKACETLFGRLAVEAIGSTDCDVFGPEEAARFAVQDQVALRVGAAETVEDEAVTRPDGSVRHIRTRKVAVDEAVGQRFVVGVCEDMTDRRANEARIAHLAHHDVLTDLPNRFLFGDRLASALTRIGDGCGTLAVLCIDLDGFKTVNDTYGHAMGDQLLRIVAGRLRAALRDCDTAARFGGDEFVVLRAPISGTVEVAELAERLLENLGKPYPVEGHRLSVSASIGIVTAGSRLDDTKALLGSADEALYRAKREGRNTYRFAHAPVAGGAQGLSGLAGSSLRADDRERSGSVPACPP